MQKNKLTVGLFWHSFKSNNLGVMALTDANMGLIADAAGDIEIDFVVFGSRGNATFSPPDDYGRVRHIDVSSVLAVKSIFDEIRKCDLVYDIGGGDSFADIYGWKRLSKVAGLKLVAAAAGRRPVLSPQTIGPFTSPSTRAVGKTALRACADVFARDRPSYERARKLLGNSSSPALHLSSDVAFSLKRLEDWPSPFPEMQDGKKHVGINVSGLLYEGGYAGDNQFGLSVNYPSLIDGLVGNLSSNADVQCWLVPHVFNPAEETMESDLRASRKVVERFPQARLAPVFDGPREAKTFISRMDLMLAARMHAAIAAVSSGTACVPMAYSVKFEGLFKSIGYPVVMDLKSVSDSDAMKLVMDCLADSEALKEKARTAGANAMTALQPYRDKIARDLAEAQSRR